MPELTRVEVDCSQNDEQVVALTADEVAEDEAARAQEEARLWTRAALAAEAIEEAKAAGVPDVLLAMIGWGD